MPDQDYCYVMLEEPGAFKILDNEPHYPFNHAASAFDREELALSGHDAPKLAGDLQTSRTRQDQSG